MFDPERPPEIIAQRWLNSDTKRTLKAEKGKVVIVAIWQLACPGSQKYGLPQAMRLRRAFEEDEVAVLGLHMAFENFAEQLPDKVEAYLVENEITIPVALDKRDKPTTAMPDAANRRWKLSRCCRTRTVVGAATTAW